MYATLPNYRNNWLRLGFTDEDIDSTADHFLDALVAWGDADTVRARVEEHITAGADHVCIQAMTSSGPVAPAAASPEQLAAATRAAWPEGAALVDEDGSRYTFDTRKQIGRAHV